MNEIKKIEGKKYALNNSYFKNRKHNYPDTILEIVKYKQQFGKLPFNYTASNWLYESMIERQKRHGVQNDQYLTPEKTAAQIAELTNNFQPKDDIVLDACCGMGQLTKYLLQNKLNVIGFDIDPDMVEICRLSYPEATFELYNFLDMEILQQYDLIVSNPPHSQKDIASFFNWLSSALNDEGKAILLIPKDYMKKEKPQLLAEYLKRFDTLHQEGMQESFYHTNKACEICIVGLTDTYKEERSVKQKESLYIQPEEQESNNKKVNIMTTQDLKKIQNVRMDKIEPNPLNPRKKISDSYIRELAGSMKTVGLLQAITLRRKDEKLQIVAGECRYRAFLLNGEETIPAVIGDYSDEEVMVMALAENLNRKDLSPLEEANAFYYFIHSNSYTVEDLNLKFGKSDAYIRGRLKLLGLITEFKDMLDGEELTIGASIELSKYSETVQKEVYEEHYKIDDTSNWTMLKTKELADRLVRLYTMNLSDYDFDKTCCKACYSNTDNGTLFDECKGRCANLECLRKKQAEHMLNACKLYTQKEDVEIIVTPSEKINTDIVQKLGDEGIEIKTVVAFEAPKPPLKPKREDFKLECDYNDALKAYKLEDLEYSAEYDEFEKKVESGEYKRCLHIGDNNPKVCYVPVNKSNQGETVAQLQEQDKKNRESTIGSITKGSLDILRAKELPSGTFSMFEEEVYLYLMLNNLDKKYFPLFGITDTRTEFLTDKEKERIIKNITVVQYGFLKRKFILRSLLSPYVNVMKSSKLQFYITKFAEQHFPEDVNAITTKYMDLYAKSKKKIEGKINKIENRSTMNKIS